jgi:hypothetical protein
MLVEAEWVIPGALPARLFHPDWDKRGEHVAAVMTARRRAVIV